MLKDIFTGIAIAASTLLVIVLLAETFAQLTREGYAMGYCDANAAEVVNDSLCVRDSIVIVIPR
jgi:hypothetical protein